MKRREIRKYLFDMLKACDLLIQFTENKTLVDYLSDSMLRSAVERQFEIIGEALGQALRHDPSLGDEIHYVGRIIAFRNRLIHGYALVDNEVVWGVLESHLPALRTEVKALLDE